MIYELRHYVPVPGKAEALVRRFEERTLALFEAVGFKVADFWVEADGSGDIWYVMEWQSRREMEDGWKRWRQEPRWLEIKAATQADGPLLERFDSIVLERPGFFSSRAGTGHRASA